MMVKELKLKTSGSAKGTFLVTGVELKPFANKPGNFLSCEFSDMSGSIKGIMWDGLEPIKKWLKSDMVVEVSGTMATYKETPQLVISTMTECTEFDRSTFVPSLGPEQIAAIMERLDARRKTISNPICQKIWMDLLDHREGWSPVVSKRIRFSTCPGGKGTVHHAYCGGLAMHSESMVKIADDIAERYGLDKDLLATGCLIHDMGKMDAYKWDIAIDMTDAGRLLHHTALGHAMLLRMAADTSIDRDDVTLLKLAHIVVSHHGDEGGFTKPMFPEAVAISMIDNLDATTTFSVEYTDKPENKDAGTNWTKFCQLTGRFYFIPGKTS